MLHCVQTAQGKIMFDSSATSAEVTAAIITAAVSLLTSFFTLIATVVNTPLKYWLDQRSVKSKLRLEYEQTQRSRIRDLIVRYKGLALEAAESLDHRFWNLYKNDPDGWLNVTAPYKGAYYFRSWIYRILKLLTIARAFEQEALFIDPRLAEADDYDFVHVVKSWSWALCDVSLFDGIEYDHSAQRDHVFRDNLRAMCETLWEKGKFVTREKFDQLLVEDQLLRPICKLFVGLSSTEPRLRWDRLVCAHLLVLLFLNEFGYASQRATDEQLREISGHIKHPKIRQNLHEWLSKLGLMNSKEGKRLANILVPPTA